MVGKGKIVWVSGPAVRADGMSSTKMYETIEVGESKLIGEVLRLTGDIAFIQVYESTSGLRPGEPVVGIGQATVGFTRSWNNWQDLRRNSEAT